MGDEAGDHLLSGPVPSQCDQRICTFPFFVKGSELQQCAFCGLHADLTKIKCGALRPQKHIERRRRIPPESSPFSDAVVSDPNSRKNAEHEQKFEPIVTMRYCDIAVFVRL